MGIAVKIQYTCPYKRTEFLKTDSESSFPDGSGRIFNFYLAFSWAEKTRLENSGTDPRGFAAAETGFWCGKTSRISFATL